MSDAARLDLSRRRDLGDLLRDSLRVVLRDARTFAAIALAVAAPVELIVSGVGLEQLWSEYDPDPDPAVALVPIAVGYLVTAPLLAAMTIHAVLEAAAGRRPSARRSIQAGLDVFAPLFLAIAIAAVGVAAGFVAFVVPGVFLAVRWYFVAQAVAIDGRRGTDALRRSWDVVAGSWWRVFGIGVAVSLLAGLAGVVVALPLSFAAEASDLATFEVLSGIATTVVAGPFIAVASTLLYFDLVAGRATVSAPPPVVPPPPA